MNGLGRGSDKQNKEKTSVMTRETVGMTLLLFGFVLLLIVATGPYLFGDVGRAITAFFIGLAGFFVYPLLALLIYGALKLVSGKKFIAGSWVARVMLVITAVFFIVHTATAERFAENNYGGYLAACWSAASESVSGGTGGGVLLGIVGYPVRYLLQPAGAYVLFSVLLLLAIWFLLLGTPLKNRLLPSTRRPRNHAPAEREIGTEGKRPYPGGMAFDEIPTAPRTPMPARPYEPAPYTPPVSAPAPAPVPKNSTAYARSVLFEEDAAASYRANLIYDADSRFNSQPRRSSMERSAEEARAMHASPRPGESGSYSSRYSSQAETARPSMPRRVTEDRPESGSGYSYPVQDEYDSNYPQAPSYRAPQPPAEPVRDPYVSDVPTPEPKESIFEELPRFTSLGDTGTSPVEPERPVERSPFERRMEVAPIVPPPVEEPAAPAQPEKSDEVIPTSGRERDSAFRSLFSRPVEEHTSLGRTEPEDPYSLRTDFSRGSDLTRGNDRARGLDIPVEPEPSEEPAPFEELPRGSRVLDSGLGRSAANMFDDDDADDVPETEPAPEPPVRSRGLDAPRGDRLGGERFGRVSGRGEAAPVPPAPEPEPEPEPQPKPKHIYKEFIRPSLGLFQQYDDSISVSQEEIARNSTVILETLLGFRVKAEVIKVTCGSSVTRYDIDVPNNVSVKDVVKRDAEIAMRLHAKDGVNMYPNLEHGAISIEVPNIRRATVGMRSIMAADEFTYAKPGSLMFVMGKDVDGRNVYGNITKMKHLLVAGSTGSGKSVCLNAMLISLISKYSPEDLRLILIDPKKVEFAVYDNLPHLMINEIIADPQKAVTALNWAIKEMERRYLLFEQKTRAGVTVREIDEYNNSRTEDEEKMPKIVIVFDELADFMAVAKKDIEERIQRLAAKARAAGIHLVLATQRPSVDVITGTIKSNLPTRIAFRVIQGIDSQVILDAAGAEKLLGNGDMLYRTEGMFNNLRVQGAYISSSEVQNVVAEIKANNEAYFDETVADYFNKTESSDSEGGVSAGGGGEGGGDVDPVYIRALAIVVKLGSASISLIQRKCSVGYNHAGKIIEWMESKGFISEFDGKAKARTVLLTKEEFESMYGGLD